MKEIQNELSEQEEKKRKLLLVAPIIILPFLTFLLWSVGLVGSTAKASNGLTGLNFQLPDAHFKEEKSRTKMSFYDQAEKDSIRYREDTKSDPFYKTGPGASFQLPEGRKQSLQEGYDPLSPNYLDTSENKVRQKLAQLNSVLYRKATEEPYSRPKSAPSQTGSGLPSSDVDRLEQMLQSVSRKDDEADPETEQISGMMDKILDIQHPERIKDRLQKLSQENQKTVYPVQLKKNDATFSFLGAKDTSGRDLRKDSVSGVNGFYSLEKTTTDMQDQNAIEAVTEEAQILTSGSVVKLSLVNDVYIAGRLLPEGTFLYGIASLSGERMLINLTTIRSHNNILPVALSVYDMDGLAGIYIPGSLNREVAKQSGSEAINTLGITSLDPSLGAQAAGAGIAAAKSLLSKHARQLRVTVPAGYKLLLRDESQK